MSSESLVERLRFWRAERPDEWQMDEFIWAAAKLEQERNELAAQVERLHDAANGLIADCEEAIFNDESVFCVNHDVVSDLEELLAETPPTALTALKALKDSYFREFCDCNVTARKIQMATSKGLKVTGFLTDDGKCCIDGKVQPLEELKAQWNCPTVEHGKNRYGLDVSYFRDVFNRELNRTLQDYRPHELARNLLRMACTADKSVIAEAEFSGALKVEWQADILLSTAIQIAAGKPEATPIQIAMALLEESNRIRQDKEEACE